MVVSVHNLVVDPQKKSGKLWTVFEGIWTVVGMQGRLTQAVTPTARLKMEMPPMPDQPTLDQMFVVT